MRTSNKNITTHPKNTGISPAGTSLCLRQRGTTAYLDSCSIDELGKSLIARGEQQIDKASDRIIGQLRKGELLSDEAVSRISEEAANNIVQRILPKTPSNSLSDQVNTLVQKPSRVLGF